LGRSLPKSAERGGKLKRNEQKERKKEGKKEGKKEKRERKRSREREESSVQTLVDVGVERFDGDFVDIQDVLVLRLELLSLHL
jgi:hypothetical protein